jgi:hypothetical protein
MRIEEDRAGNGRQTFEPQHDAHAAGDKARIGLRRRRRGACGKLNLHGGRSHRLLGSCRCLGLNGASVQYVAPRHHQRNCILSLDYWPAIQCRSPRRRLDGLRERASAGGRRRSAKGRARVMRVTGVSSAPAAYSRAASCADPSAGKPARREATMTLETVVQVSSLQWRDIASPALSSRA